MYIEHPFPLVLRHDDRTLEARGTRHVAALAALLHNIKAVANHPSPIA
jgi:hypothetical protein